MPNSPTDRIQLSIILRAIFLTALAVILPNSAWAYFGWLVVFQPLIAFILLSKFGNYTGKRILFAALCCALPAFLVQQNFYLFLLSVTMFVAGGVLHHSSDLGESPAMSGSKMVIVTGLGWGILWYSFSIADSPAPYSQLIAGIQAGIVEAITYYQSTTDIPADAGMLIVSTLYQMKKIVPVILPSLFGSLVLLLCWFTMVVANILLGKGGNKTPWPAYQYWKLPKWLIWTVICCGVISLLPVDSMRILTINCLILLSVVYCYQGLAITVFFMNRWNVPILLRSFLYVMIVFQSLGTLLLLILGIAESWFDFRKQNQQGSAQ